MVIQKEENNIKIEESALILINESFCIINTSVQLSRSWLPITKLLNLLSDIYINIYIPANWMNFRFLITPCCDYIIFKVRFISNRHKLILNIISISSYRRIIGIGFRFCSNLQVVRSFTPDHSNPPLLNTQGSSVFHDFYLIILYLFSSLS